MSANAIKNTFNLILDQIIMAVGFDSCAFIFAANAASLACVCDSTRIEDIKGQEEYAGRIEFKINICATHKSIDNDNNEDNDDDNDDNITNNNDAIAFCLGNSLSSS